MLNSPQCVLYLTLRIPVIPQVVHLDAGQKDQSEDSSTWPTEAPG